MSWASWIIAIGALALATPRSEEPAQAAAPVAQSAERTWTLPQDEPPLPGSGPDREMFYGACPTCHSTRYITDQPAFSRETWTKEVDKMRKAYGVQLKADEAEAIVRYLVEVNGR